jgi:2-methylisocitrate lyase-like PEP mutase family enzyme
LHAGPEVLLLANAWDAGSARLTETLGAKAVATSSAAVAWSHGYADGHHLPFEVLVNTAREIARVIRIPLSVDSEGGYAEDPAGAAANITRLIDVGVVGINIEDGTAAPELLCAKISAVRAAAQKAGVKLFINARADVYLKNLAEGDAAQTETLRRGALYRDAGADGLFVPAAVDATLFATIASEVKLPLNVMSRPGVPPLAKLREAGVRRLSAATAIARAAWEGARAASAAFLAAGDSDGLAQFTGAPMDHNALFRDR